MRRQTACKKAVAQLLVAVGFAFASANLTMVRRCDAQSAAVRFTDVSVTSGIQFTHTYRDPTSFLYRLVVGGVAAGDYDGDGWVDLYTLGGDGGSNHLLRNRRDGSFEDVAVAAGVALPNSRGSGPTFADYDGDGHLDLFVGAIEQNGPTLFHNSGDGTFAAVTVAAGLNFELGPYVSAAFGDYDRDGDLDLFVTQWGTLLENLNMPDETRRLEHLWRNNGDGTFTGYTSESGLTLRLAELSGLHWYWTFTPNFADINNDGWPDLLLAADFKNSQVFMNTGAGRFTDATTSAISDENGMGAAVGDYDNDGDLDWFVSSIFDVDGGTEDWGGSGNRLYRNAGDGSFVDVTDAAGVRDGAWGWGSCFADFNNDGFLDLFHVEGWGVVVGRSKFFEKTSRLFLSNRDGTFTQQAVAAGITDTDEGRGVVCFDYDRDGDVDLFIANNAQLPRLYRNENGYEQHFLEIKLHGRAPNSEAIGARVYVTANGQTQMRELRAGSNYVSQDPAMAHFGLGANTVVDELRVVWPDQEILVHQDVAADQFLDIDSDGLITPSPTPIVTPTATGMEVPPTETATALPKETASPTSTLSIEGPTPTATPSLPPSLRGDANCDGIVAAADLIALVQRVGTPQSWQCGGADVNGDGMYDMGDVQSLFVALFDPS